MVASLIKIEGKNSHIVQSGPMYDDKVVIGKSCTVASFSSWYHTSAVSKILDELVYWDHKNQEFNKDIVFETVSGSRYILTIYSYEEEDDDNES